MKNHKNIGFPCNTGPDPIGNHKATYSQLLVLGNHRLASEMPFQWHFAGGLMMAHPIQL